MARPFPSDTIMPEGNLDIQSISESVYWGYFTPPNEALPHEGYDRKDFKRRIFEVDVEKKSLTIFPFQVWGLRCMQPKYYVLESIRLDLKDIEAAYFKADNVEAFFNSILPGAFVEDHNYGLGFKKGYRSIVSMLEHFGMDQLHITLTGKMSLDPTNNKAVISRQDLHKMTKAIDNLTSRTQRISLKLKKELVGDLFFDLLDYEPLGMDNGRSTAAITKFIKDKSIRKANDDKEERTNAVKIIKEQGRQIASENPEVLVKLRQDIELVTLEELIARFEDMMNKKLGENHWQKLLNQNPFILNMAFGVPVISVEEQASVGGTKFSGTGGKIADYLMQNSVSGNAALVEIKTPSLKLLSAQEYRVGVFAPAPEISAAVNQLLDQIYVFQKNFNHLKVDSRNNTIESFAVRGILIAGRSLSNSDEHKSFEMFRGNSKNVQIITFDELLGNLKALHKFLSPGIDKVKPFGSVPTIEDPDLPF
ncbi:MAG: Shedu immune nuclease family protein [Bacteroidota bacterium]